VTSHCAIGFFLCAGLWDCSSQRAHNSPFITAVAIENTVKKCLEFFAQIGLRFVSFRYLPHVCLYTICRHYEWNAVLGLWWLERSKSLLSKVTNNWNYLERKPVCSLSTVHHRTLFCLHTYIVLAVSCWLPTTAAWVRAWVRSCGICGEQSGIRADLPRELRFLVPLIPPTAPHSSSIIRGWYNRPNSGLRTKYTQSHPNPRN
jgi:hypothetical protein